MEYHIPFLDDVCEGRPISRPIQKDSDEHLVSPSKLVKPYREVSLDDSSLDSTLTSDEETAIEFSPSDARDLHLDTKNNPQTSSPGANRSPSPDHGGYGAVRKSLFEGAFDSSPPNTSPQSQKSAKTGIASLDSQDGFDGPTLDLTLANSVEVLKNQLRAPIHAKHLGLTRPRSPRFQVMHDRKLPKSTKELEDEYMRNVRPFRAQEIPSLSTPPSSTRSRVLESKNPTVRPTSPLFHPIHKRELPKSSEELEDEYMKSVRPFRARQAPNFAAATPPTAKADLGEGALPLRKSYKKRYRYGKKLPEPAFQFKARPLPKFYHQIKSVNSDTSPLLTEESITPSTCSNKPKHQLYFQSVLKPSPVGQNPLATKQKQLDETETESANIPFRPLNKAPKKIMDGASVQSDVAETSFSLQIEVPPHVISGGDSKIDACDVYDYVEKGGETTIELGKTISVENSIEKIGETTTELEKTINVENSKKLEGQSIACLLICAVLVLMALAISALHHSRFMLECFGDYRMEAPVILGPFRLIADSGSNESFCIIASAELSTNSKQKARFHYRVANGDVAANPASFPQDKRSNSADVPGKVDTNVDAHLVGYVVVANEVTFDVKVIDAGHDERFRNSDGADTGPIVDSHDRRSAISSASATVVPAVGGKTSSIAIDVSTDEDANEPAFVVTTNAVISETSKRLRFATIRCLFHRVQDGKGQSIDIQESVIEENIVETETVLSVKSDSRSAGMVDDEAQRTVEDVAASLSRIIFGNVGRFLRLMVGPVEPMQLDYARGFIPVNHAVTKNVGLRGRGISRLDANAPKSVYFYLYQTLRAIKRSINGPKVIARSETSSNQAQRRQTHQTRSPIPQEARGIESTIGAVLFLS